MWYTIRSHLCDIHCHIATLWHIWWSTLLCLIFVIHVIYMWHPCDTHIRSHLLWHTFVMFHLLYDTSVTHICHKLYDTHLIQILSHGSSLWHAHDTHMYHVIPLWHTCYKHVIIHLVTCIWYINNILYHCDANMSYLTIVITMIHAHYHLSYTTQHMRYKHLSYATLVIHMFTFVPHMLQTHTPCVTFLIPMW